jgi:hypothetical protein
MTDNDEDTAWESYNFHYEILNDLQRNNDEVIIKYNKFLDDNINPQKREVALLRKEMNDSYDSLIMGYEKCIQSINELINGHKSVDVSRECLNEYKNITYSQYEVAKMEQTEINEVLG